MRDSHYLLSAKLIADAMEQIRHAPGATDPNSITVAFAEVDCPHGHHGYVLHTIMSDFLCLECSCRFHGDGSILWDDHCPSPLLDAIRQATPEA